MKILLKLSNKINAIRCLFKPHNVIKISRLPVTWVERDKLLFHAMFQVLVDFIEIDKPFAPPDFKGERFTSRKIMAAEIKKMRTAAYVRSKMTGNINSVTRTLIVEEVMQMADAYAEMLYIYDWYRNREYEYEYRLDLGLAERIADQEKHEAKCSQMLNRIVAVRKHFWT